MCATLRVWLEGTLAAESRFMACIAACGANWQDLLCRCHSFTLPQQQPDEIKTMDGHFVPNMCGLLLLFCGCRCCCCVPGAIAAAGGQKVKLVLAAAMWNNPHLLIMDEPTNYLDRVRGHA